MNLWKLALPVAIMVFSSVAQAEVSKDPKLLADGLFRTGLDFCNAASKKSRSDTAGARADFNEYLSHLERAKTIYPELMRENQFAKRESTRCELVQDNIARAEAMPIIEESLVACSEAKNALRGEPNLATAKEKHTQYMALRDKALATTPTVLRVGSVAVQLRVCDRLEEKISLVQTNQNRTIEMSTRTIAAFQKAADTCSVGKDMLKNRSNNLEKIQAADQLLARLRQDQQQANKQATALLTDQIVAKSAQQQIKQLQSSLKRCQSQVVAKQEAARKAHKADQLAAAEAKKAAEENIVAAETAPDGVLEGGEVAHMDASDL